MENGEDEVNGSEKGSNDFEELVVGMELGLGEVFVIFAVDDGLTALLYEAGR